MRKMIALALLLALLTGCAGSVQPAGDETVFLYYRRLDAQSDESFASETGALAEEATAFGADADPEKLLARYLAGPETDGLVTIFPEGTECLGVKKQGTTLILDMNEFYAALSGFDRTLAAAGLTLTLTQLSGVEAVSIKTPSGALLGQGNTAYRAEDFLLQDMSWLFPERTVQLYFEGPDGRLQAEKRAIGYQTPEELPENTLAALLEGPEDKALSACVPAGTQILDCSLDADVCTVVFSEEFTACDTDRESAELAVHSVAATLCGLSEVESVQLMLVSGEDLTYCSIAEPLTPERAWYN